MENTAKKTNKKSKLFTLAMVVALAAFIMASCGGTISGWFKGESRSNYKLEDFKKEVNVLHEKYDRETQALYDDFRRKMEYAGNQNFQQAESNIDSVMEHFTGFKATGYLVYLMAYDKVAGSEHTHKYISNHMGQAIITPCVSGNQDIQEALKDFLHRLQEKSNAFHAELARKFNKLPAGSASLEGRKFVANLEKIDAQITEMVIRKAWLSIGLVIEAACYKNIVRILWTIAGKVALKAAGSITISILDGPLPIGDIIAVAGLAWCAWDIYQVEKVLPGELRTHIRQAITEYQRDSREAALNVAAEALEVGSISAKNAAAEVQ